MAAFDVPATWLEQLSVPSARGLYWVVGANGAGKSRLAKLLAERAHGARLVSSETQQAFYEQQLREDEANFRQGVDTSVTVGALLGDGAKTHPLFEAFRLGDLWTRGYRKLSTGEARKVLVLAALLDRPTLLILDEPFDGVDAAARAELQRGLVELARELPVVLVGSSETADFESPGVGGVAREVAVVEREEYGSVLAWVGPHAAWLTRASQAKRSRPAPPIQVGSYFEPLTTETLVELRQGRVRYGEHVVFENLDWSLRTGEHTLIEGPNGSGKSTLLGLVTGDNPQAYSNELWLFGRRRGTGESVWDIKRRIGLVSGQLHRDFRNAGSVEDVLVRGLYDSIGIYRDVEPSDRARARAWFEWLALPSVSIHAPFRELSYGQQRLVLIARAAIKVPPLVVLDEPTNGLDGENQAAVLDLIESLCRQTACTVLFVTHRKEEREFWERRVGGAKMSLA